MPTLRAAPRKARISAWAVGSFAVTERLCALARIFPSGETTTAPTGISPAAAPFSASRRAARIHASLTGSAARGPFFIWGDPPPALRWFHYAGYHPRPTDQDRRGPRPRGAQENPGAVREIDRVPDARIPTGSARGAAERHLPRAVRRDGDRQGHRHLLDVRAPHAAVLREVPRGVHAAQAHRRAVEDRPRRRALRPPAAGPGAADAGDRDRPHGHAPTCLLYT